MKTLKVLCLAAVLAVGAMVSAGTAYADTHIQDEDSGYVEYGGSFSSDSNCGIRGDCLYGLNIDEPASCVGWDEPGQGCDASRTRWRKWDFWDEYYAVHGQYYAHQWDPSNAYVFIPSEHATTREARYIESFFFYDPNLCPNLCGVQDYTYVDQYSYYDAWVETPFNSRQVNDIYLSNTTDEPTNWYYVGWEAAKVEY